MSFIAFLAQGPSCPALQEIQLDYQLSRVTIAYCEDRRTIEQIKDDASTYDRSYEPHYENHVCTHFIPAWPNFIISIDYNGVDRVKQIWTNFHWYSLRVLSAAAAVLAGLITLQLSGMVTNRSIVLVQFAVACFFVIVLSRAEQIFAHKPPFQAPYNRYTLDIFHFRRKVIAEGQESLEKAKILLPNALQARATEFFTENEKKFLGFVKS